MNDIVERVARKLCCPSGICSAAKQNAEDAGRYVFLVPCGVTHCFADARTAIATLRDATPEMWSAGNRKLHVETGEIGEIWRAMIDAALAPTIVAQRDETETGSAERSEVERDGCSAAGAPKTSTTSPRGPEGEALKS